MSNQPIEDGSANDRTPNKKPEAASVPVSFVNFNGHLKSDSREVRDAAFQYLRGADFILAGDGEHLNVFFGVDHLIGWLADKPNDDVLQIVYIVVETGKLQQHADEIVEIVNAMKGSCCYGDRDCRTVESFVASCFHKNRLMSCMAKAVPTGGFMFAHKGAIVIYSKGTHFGPIIARDRDAARKYVKGLGKQGDKISIVDTNAVYSRSLEDQVAFTFAEGADCVFVIESIDDDSVQLKFVEPWPSGAE